MIKQSKMIDSWLRAKVEFEVAICITSVTSVACFLSFCKIHHLTSRHITYTKSFMLQYTDMDRFAVYRCITLRLSVLHISSSDRKV